ncbi:hypothetical protein SAMN05216349_10622 [Oribacterium sp. KHPX15]|nr:hypothetical protein SAMN05216349_10622 [Oribacterium sp. KHPX15]
MSYTKKTYLYALNSILPLFCGLFIYLTKRDDTLVAHLLSSLRSLMPVIDYPAPIHNFAADFLWTYSMFFCLRLTLGDDLCGKYNSFVFLLTAIVAVVIECLQLTKVFPGTFDFLDIVIELVAAVAALLISNMIERRNKYHEKD